MFKMVTIREGIPRKKSTLFDIVALLHKLRELSHLLRLMKLALAPKQSDYTGLYCRTVGGQWNWQRFLMEFAGLGL